MRIGIGVSPEDISTVVGATPTLPRTGRILQLFPGQAAQSWSEALVLAKQTVNGTDYLLVGGTCDYSGVYTGGAGSFNGVQFDWVLSRYLLSNGTPDITFGTYGSWRIHYTPTDNEMGGLLVDSSNRIVMAGIAWDGTGVSQTFHMVRLLADGTLDLNFGAYGYGTYYAAENGRYQCSNLTTQSSGKIISYTDRFTGGAHSARIGRHHLNGAFDTGFGKSTPPSHQGFLEIEPSLQDTEGSNYYGHILADGTDKLYVSGRYDVSGSSHYEGFVCRVLADGSATDNTFGAQVAATGVWMKLVDFSLGVGNLSGICFNGTGVLASGSAKRDASEHQAGAIVLLDSTGALVASFNITGVLETHQGGQNSDYLFQPVVTVGGAFRFFGMTGSGNQDLANTVTATAHLLSIGLTAAGVLDTTWNATGIYEDSSNTLSAFFNTLLLADGRILASGHIGYPTTAIAQGLIHLFKANGTADATFGALVTPLTPPAAPTVVTGASSSITSTTASLAGTVNPNSTATTYHFEYGLTTDYLNKTVEVSVGAGAVNVNASASLTGLLPGKTYHWRLVAYNGTIGLGNDANFTASAGTLTVLSDSMTDTDGTLLRDHTGKGEVDYTGSFYKEVSGRGSIESNKARFDSDPDHASPNQRWLVHRDVALTNLTVTGTFVYNGNNNGNNRPTGVVCRVQTQGEYSANEDNLLYAGWKADNSTFVLGYMLSGTLTNVDSIAFTVVQGVSNTITLTISAEAATATITGGSRSLTGDMTPAAALAANTNVGWYMNRGIGDTIDDFVVTTP